MTEPALPRAGHALRVPDAAEPDEGEQGGAGTLGAGRERGDRRGVGHGTGRAGRAQQRGEEPRQLDGAGQEGQPGIRASAHTDDDRRHPDQQGPGRCQCAEEQPRGGAAPSVPGRQAGVGEGTHQPEQRGVGREQGPLPQPEPLDDERVPHREARDGHPGRDARAAHDPVRAPPGEREHPDHRHPADHRAVDHGADQPDDGVEGRRPRRAGAQPEGLGAQREGGGEDEVPGERVPTTDEEGPREQHHRHDHPEVERQVDAAGGARVPLERHDGGLPMLARSEHTLDRRSWPRRDP